MKIGAELSSYVYLGWIRHRRFIPKSHVFRYPIFMLYLDLDELPQVLNRRWYCSLNRFNILSFHRKDYFGAEQATSDSPLDLKQAVIERVNQQALSQGKDQPRIAKVRILTHARYFNFIFNPVSFYYCFDAREQLVAIVAEITNTPWNEKHAYVLQIGDDSLAMHYQAKGKNKHLFSFTKEFHVSPFNPMNMDYQWVFSEPMDRLSVHMKNVMANASGGHDQHFDATLVMDKKQLAQQLPKILIRYPFMCVSVVVGIYWQAFKLWLKRVPFYDHPGQYDSNLDTPLGSVNHRSMEKKT